MGLISLLQNDLKNNKFKQNKTTKLFFRKTLVSKLLKSVAFNGNV